MFQTIILPNHRDLANLISDKVTIYPRSNKYIACITSEENIPVSIKNQLVPVIINTGVEIPVKAYQKYYSDVSDITDPVLNRQLMTLRSKLVYSVSENLAPDNFYFKLELPMNDDSTRRTYIYKLYYDEIPCYMLKDDTFLDILPQQLGPLITSTYSLNIEDIPHWYTKEMFRDTIDLKDIVIIEGPTTEELYLFYQEEVNITEDILDELINEIRGQIISAVQLKIFPRNTPNEFIKNRQLKILNNGQWYLPYDVSKDINIFATSLQLHFTLKNIDELFWFLVWMLICPTYSFIEKELKISVESDSIKICYLTKYLPDYLRVNTASRINTAKTINKVLIFYPDRLSTEEFSKLVNNRTYVSFYDNENNERALLIHPKIDIPQINKTTPIDFSLNTRILYDINLIVT
jgi:hypothetical protein